jgi:NADPH2:quinone reductase
MQAFVRKQFGGPEVLELVERPEPALRPGTVKIAVRAFGLNRAELYMRSGQWGEVAAISGIECVGTVLEDATGRLAAGQTVMALMGGMGRGIDGSYASCTVVPASNVVAIDTDLPWETLAALPESYATAWTCLHRNLAIAPGQRLLVRGGTSSLGRAAIDLARQHGVQVIATTRDDKHVGTLREAGAHEVLVAGPVLGEVAGGAVDAVLDLVGNSSVLDSMRPVRRGGRVCLAGFLGGLAPLAQFDPLSQMPSDVQLSFFGSFNFGSAAFALSDVPLQQMADMVATGALRARPARVFEFKELAQAHALMEAGAVQGKCVVRLPG